MIKFVEETHEYFNNGKKLISVTQLMRKHGLAPNYDGVPSEVLKAKAERGTLIHKEIEQFIKKGEIGFTSELGAFRAHLDLYKLTPFMSEEIVYNDIVAGTVDLIFADGTIADIKTTATLHKEAISWQLSIYAYLIKGLTMERGQAYHFNSDGWLNVVDIPLKPMAEVEKLLECERRGEIYKQELTEVDQQLAELTRLEKLIRWIDDQKKSTEAKAQEMRTAIMEAMEANGVKSFENESLKLTYIAPTTRTAIDSARLKKEMPEIADKYTKTSNVKASLRITLKGVDNG